MEIESRFVGTRERHQMTEYGVCAPGRSCVLLVLVCSVVSFFYPYAGFTAALLVGSVVRVVNTQRVICPTGNRTTCETKRPVEAQKRYSRSWFMSDIAEWCDNIISVYICRGNGSARPVFSVAAVRLCMQWIVLELHELIVCDIRKKMPAFIGFTPISAVHG